MKKKSNHNMKNNRNSILKRTPAPFLALGFAGGAFALILAFNLLYTAIEAAVKGFVTCVEATFSPVIVFTVLGIALAIFAVVAIKRYGERKRRQGRREAHASHAAYTPKQPKMLPEVSYDMDQPVNY